MTAAIDHQGRCVVHPFVQIQRQSKRTGEWKALLDSCPLCDMEGSGPARVAAKEKKDTILSAKATRLTLKHIERMEKPHKDEVNNKKDGRPHPSNSGQSHGQRSRSDERAAGKSLKPRPKGFSLDSGRFYQSTKPRRSDKEDCADEVEDRPQRGQDQSQRKHSNERAMGKSPRPRPKGAYLDSRRSYQSFRLEINNASFNSLSSYLSIREKRDDCRGGSNQARASSRERSTSKSRDLHPKDTSHSSHRFYQSVRPDRNNTSFNSHPSYRSIREKRDDGGGGSNQARARSRERSTNKNRVLRPKDAIHSSRRSRRSHSILQSSSNGGGGRPKDRTAGLDRRRSRQTFSVEPQSKPKLTSGSSCEDRNRAIVVTDPSGGSDQDHGRYDPGEITHSVSGQAIQALAPMKQLKSQPSRGPPLAHSNSTSSVGLGPSLAFIDSAGSLGPNTLSFSGSVDSINNAQQYRQPIMVMTRPGYEGEVSTLSNSLQSLSSSLVIKDVNRNEDKHTEGKNHRGDTSWVGPMINTAVFDSKGRCVRHPYIKLRKKKLLGGWKVIMSACPDCCLAEVNRLWCVEENKKKVRERRERKEDEDKRRMKKRRDGVESRRCRSSGRGTSSPSPNSSRRSRSSGSSGCGSCGNLSSGCGSRGNLSSGCGSRGNLSAASIPPTPAPECSQSQGNASRLRSPRSVMKFKKLRPTRPWFDASGGTASLTGSSSSSLVPTAGKGGATDPTNIPMMEAPTDSGDFESDPYPKEHPPQARRQPPCDWQPPRARQGRGTVRVRGMPWVDPKDGWAGTYTGAAKDQLVPHEHGAVKYHSGGTREGEWDEGRHSGGRSSGRPPGPRPGFEGRGGRRPSLNQRLQWRTLSQAAIDLD